MTEAARLEDAVADTGARHIVPISGGKDSSALAIWLSQRYPDVPFEYVTSDTGVELPELYTFLSRLECILGKPIVRVSALEMLGVAEKEGRTAFDVALYDHFSGFLPSPRTRWCTRILKILPFERHVGADKAYSYIAIRADENREGYVGTGGKPVLLSEKPNITPVYPFKDRGMGLADIHGVLEESGVGLPDYYGWRSRSGCFFCFYQQIGEWQGLNEHHPDLFAAAKEYETGRNGRKYTWVDGRTLDQVAKMPRREIKAKADTAGCAVCHL